MQTLILSLLLTTLPTARPAGPQASTLLSTAPEDALVLAYTPDVSDLRDAALGSDWYGYFVEGPGSAYVDAFRDLLVDEDEEGASELLAVVDSLRPLLSAADGELLIEVTERGLGLTLAAGAAVEETDGALTAFLEELPVEWTVTESRMLEHTLQLWRLEGEPVVVARSLGEGVLRLFLGKEQEDVLPVLRGAISREPRAELAPGAARIAERLRGGAPRIVLAADLSRFARFLVAQEPEAEHEELERVVRAIGLDRPTWGLADLHRGADGALHQVMRLEFAPETGMARVAGNLHRIEPADLAGVPLGADYLGLGRVDVVGLLDTVLELGGPELAETWDEGMMAAESATGVHVEEDVLGLLAGGFAFWRERWPEGGVSLEDPLQGVTVRIGVLDGEALQDSLLDLLDSTGAGDLFELDEVDGLDAWSPGGGPGLPSLVFAPGAVLVVGSGVDVAAVVARHRAGEAPSGEPSEAAAEVLSAVEDAFFVTRQDTIDTVRSIVSQLHLLGELVGFELGEEPTRAELAESFSGSTLVVYRRTAEGIEVVSRTD